MHPLLIEIPIFGGLRIYSYGALVATAFLLGILWTAREGQKAKPPLHSEIIFDLAFYIIISALIGSRILYIITDWQRYTDDFLAIFRIWEGGLVFYGGLIGALLTSYIYLRKKKLPFLYVADIFIPGLALGHSIGRLGCLMAGCCYGRHTDSFFAMTFPQVPYGLAPVGIPLFPSQLLESVAAFGIFLILVMIRKRQHFRGQVFLSYLVIYSIVRSILEIFRGDLERGFVIPRYVSTSQFISLCLILATLFTYSYLRKKNQTQNHAIPSKTD